MNLKKLTLAVAGLTLCSSGAMAAEDLSYSWVEADYAILDISDVDDGNIIDDFDDGDGWALRGSFAFTENWFVFGSFADTEADYSFFDNDDLLIPANIDVERLNLGLGYAMPLGGEGSNTDMVFRGAYTDVDLGEFGLGGSSGDDSFDDLNEDSTDGWFVDAGLRSQMTERIEGSIGLRYTDLEEVDNLGFYGGLLFELTPNWGINLEADWGDEVSTYFVGARYSFGQ